MKINRTPKGNKSRCRCAILPDL